MGSNRLFVSDARQFNLDYYLIALCGWKTKKSDIQKKASLVNYCTVFNGADNNY